MLRTVLAVVLFLTLLSAIPWFWPDGFSEPPVLMIGLLGLAALVALLAGGGRRRKGWGTAAGG